MAGQLRLDPALASRLAAGPVARRVGQLAQVAAAAAAAAAPPAKTWRTAEDERVRPAHRAADGQEIPANVPYLVPRPNTGNDINDVRTGHEEAMEPRDPSLSIGNKINCRCVSVHAAGAVGASIRVEDTRVEGTRARARVVTRFPRAAESERAESGGGWMATGLRAAAAAAAGR